MNMPGSSIMKFTTKEDEGRKEGEKGVKEEEKFEIQVFLIHYDFSSDVME
jgi:hypothetical protein